MAELIEKGYYDVMIQSFGSGLSKNKNTPFAWVKFDNGLYWRGYLSRTTMKNGKSVAQSTMEQLAIMGFNGENFNDLNSENALNKDKAVNISVGHEKDDEGILRAEVTWVNPPYKKKEKSPEEIKTLQGIDVRGLMAEAKKNLNLDNTDSGNSEESLPW